MVHTDDTVDMAYTVEMVYTVDTVDTADSVHTVYTIKLLYTTKAADLEFVKCFTQVRFPTFLILPKKKRKNRDIFGKQFTNKSSVLIKLSVFCNYLRQNKLS